MTNMLKPIPPETFLQDISFQYSRTFRFSGYIFCGFAAPPLGVIDASVLIAFGEVMTFTGTLVGIDYRYRYGNKL